MEKLKSFSGEAGKVLAGDTLLGVSPYSLTVFQEYIQGHTMDVPYRIPGMKEIQGRVQGPYPIGSILKLITEEGYTLDFFITDGNGRIAASGPFLTADGKPVI